jgi:hypothetical protein
MTALIRRELFAGSAHGEVQLVLLLLPTSVLSLRALFQCGPLGRDGLVERSPAIGFQLSRREARSLLCGRDRWGRVKKLGYSGYDLSRGKGLCAGQFDLADADFLAGFAGLLGIATERQHADAELQRALQHQAMLKIATRAPGRRQDQGRRPVGTSTLAKPLPSPCLAVALPERRLTAKKHACRPGSTE